MVEEAKEEAWPPVEIAHLHAKEVELVPAGGNGNLIVMRDVYITWLPAIGAAYIFNKDGTMLMVPAARVHAIEYDHPDLIRDMKAAVAMDRAEVRTAIALRKERVKQSFSVETGQEVH